MSLPVGPAALLVTLFFVLCLSDVSRGQPNHGVHYFCEGTYSKNLIGCSTTARIRILGVFYGRVRTDVCPGQIQRTNCYGGGVGGALAKVKSWCENKPSCYVKVNNGEFGDTCPGTTKYLQVNYACGADKPTPAPQPAPTVPAKPPNHGVHYFCEGTYSKNLIGCSTTARIRIISAFYGRVKTDVCPGTIQRTNCYGSDNSHATNMVKSWCEGKPSCYVQVNNGIFGDTCYGTIKYLEVNYACGADPTPPPVPAPRVLHKCG